MFVSPGSPAQPPPGEAVRPGDRPEEQGSNAALVFQQSGELIRDWPGIVGAVRSSRPVLASHLDHARPLALDEQELTLGFHRGDLHWQSVTDERESLERLLGETLGRPIRLKVIELDGGDSAGVSTLAETLDRADREAREARLREGREHPAIRLACELLGAEVEDVRDLGEQA